ncbi:MAG: hypothetical protein C0392_03310 [Syntrophus sp. (in: bacteria)]|nr:hypothetical protein [Syntrophus sp. (in: bacteria)]
MKRFSTAVFCIAFILTFAAATNLWAQNPSKTKVLNKTYQEKSLGYAISYPGNWAYVSPTAHSVVFGPRKGVDGDPVVSIQNLNTITIKGRKYKDADSVIEYLANQLKVAKEVIVYETSPYTHDKGGAKLAGKMFGAEYALNNERYKQWIIVLPRSTGEVIHVWSYTSPIKMYEKNLGVAQNILNSWIVQ